MLRIKPISSSAHAAAVYVPLVMGNRVLAVVRVLVVGRLLGEMRKGEFGDYQLALALVNWVVPVVLFGLADVAERYAAAAAREGELAGFLRRQVVRLLAVGAGVTVTLLAAGPWVGPRWLGSWDVVALAALNVTVLAVYQWLAGVLRGLRAYGAVAGMETLAAVLLLGLSAGAAWKFGAAALLGAYLVSNVVAVGVYGGMVGRWVRGQKGEGRGEKGDAWGQKGEGRGEKGDAGAVSPHAHPIPGVGHAPPQTNTPAPLGMAPDGEARTRVRPGFGTWAFLRLMLVMTFGFVALWSVRVLAGDTGAGAKVAGDYAMPWGMAQLLAYVGVTVWASGYGIAATAWAHGGRRRAIMRFLQVGKFGGIGLLVIAAAVLAGRGVLERMVPAYGGAIERYLPAMLGVFIWYALAAFYTALGDLQERPWVGVVIWGGAVAVQVAVVASATGDASATALWASAAGAGLGAVALGPLMFARSRRATALELPLVILALAPVGYLLAARFGNEVALGITGICVGLMALLVRRAEWRRVRRRWKRESRN